jgi:hypothetical protein
MKAATGALLLSLIACERHAAKIVDVNHVPPAVAQRETAPVATSVVAPAEPAEPPPPTPPTPQVGHGLQAVRDCLSGIGKLKPRPKPLYSSKNLRGLAARLGLKTQPGEPAQDAFCEPELWPEHCGYTDCASVAGAFLIWKRDKRSDNLDSLFVLEEVGGAAKAYQLGQLYLNEPEFACGCMEGNEFAKVSQDTPDTIVAEHLGAIRPGRMCATAYTKSTWLLDAERHVVAVIVEDAIGVPPPSQVVITRSPSELRVKNGERCEAVVDWAELESAPPDPPECLEWCRGPGGKRRCCSER